jgi:hypothetical protein
MPKSKRAKIGGTELESLRLLIHADFSPVSLTKVSKKTKEQKTTLMNEVCSV